jgi:hypothetical protein
MNLSRKSNGHLMRTDTGHLMIGASSCKCQNSCWLFTIEAVTPYVGSCLDCELWNTPTEYDPVLPMYADCIIACTDDDYGFPVSFCLVGGQVYLRASLEVDNLGDCGPFYIEYIHSTPLTLDGDGCPVDGTYLCELDTSVSGNDGGPCDIPEINVTIEKIACCDANCAATEYYLSCDVVYLEYYDAGGGISTCSAPEAGTEICNTNTSLVNEPMNQSGGFTDCDRISDNEFPCYFPYYAAAPVTITCDGGGLWTMCFGDLCGTIPELDVVKDGGLTAQGTYPDVTYCYTDGYSSYSLSITNIVVT